MKRVESVQTPPVEVARTTKVMKTLAGEVAAILMLKLLGKVRVSVTSTATGV